MKAITMTQSNLKILFLHGLDSSRESTKFHAIHASKKFCIDVDYRNLNYTTVEKFYNDAIDTIRPDLLVGHSLGAYWTLKLSSKHRIPAVIANPSLAPRFRADYPPINEHDLENDIPQIAYIELGDETLDMYSTLQQLEPFMQIKTIEGGHHRLSQPENLNLLIDYMQLTFLH